MFRTPTILLLCTGLAAAVCAAPSVDAATPLQERQAKKLGTGQEAERQGKEAKDAQAQPLPSTPAEKDAALKQLETFVKEQTEAGKIDKSQPRWKMSMPFPPELELDPEKNYFWHIRTNKGDIKIRLMPEVAPMHVSSTIYLARTGFYDGVVFHRVIPGFMAQGGDPTGSGRGGPGYKYDGEFDREVKHDKPGLLSMANAGPGTDGSQFFLTFVPTPHLDGKHTIFGEVVGGMDTLKALEKAGTAPAGRTTEKLEMVSTTITAVPKKGEGAKGGAIQPTGGKVKRGDGGEKEGGSR